MPPSFIVLRTTSVLQPLRKTISPALSQMSGRHLAEQIEAAHKASLARGEVGIRDKEPVPTLAVFADAIGAGFLDAHGDLTG